MNLEANFSQWGGSFSFRCAATTFVQGGDFSGIGWLNLSDPDQEIQRSDICFGRWDRPAAVGDLDSSPALTVLLSWGDLVGLADALLHECC